MQTVESSRSYKVFKVKILSWIPASFSVFVKMEVKVDPDIVENIQKVVKEEPMMMENIKQEVKMDPEMMENDLLEMTVVISNVTSTFQ